MTLQIESGKYYRTRDGRKVGPMVEETPRWSGWPWEIENGQGDLRLMLWKDDGTADETQDADIIAEWQDDTPAHIIEHEGREYDLTALETPFGLLPEPVQQALRAWPHGWEYWTAATGWTGKGWLANRSVVARAKPVSVEVRISCYRGVAGVGGKYGTCAQLADGSIDWSTWMADE